MSIRALLALWCHKSDRSVVCSPWNSLSSSLAYPKQSSFLEASHRIAHICLVVQPCYSLSPASGVKAYLLDGLAPASNARGQEREMLGGVFPGDRTQSDQLLPLKSGCFRLRRRSCSPRGAWTLPRSGGRTPTRAT